MAAHVPEFNKMNCLLMGLSVDSAKSHQEWLQDIVAHYHVDDEDVEHCQLDLEFPMIADEDRHVANLFGMMDVTNPESLTIRSVFIIDPDQKLRIHLSYPASVGRSLDEIVRCVKALQLSYQKSVATPADWPRNHPRVKLADGSVSTEWKGSVFLLPSVSTEQALLHYPKFHTCDVPSKRKYLRLVQPVHVGVDPAFISKHHMINVNHNSRQTESTESTNETVSSTELVVQQPARAAWDWEWKWPWEDPDVKWPWEETFQWPWE